MNAKRKENKELRGKKEEKINCSAKKIIIVTFPCDSFEVEQKNLRSYVFGVFLFKRKFFCEKS